jgi:polar amino acid transport system substrate-binding protein
MTFRVAYVEEPPFYWTAADGSAVGADVELARIVLSMIGETAVEFVPVAFEDLLTGVSEGRWHMNVPIFITSERARRVTFGVPVWSLGDGFLVRAGNPKSLTGYSSVCLDTSARLGLIPGQVQFDAAEAAGVPSDQIVTFASQPEAVVALQAGRIDAFAATTIGNRAIVADNPDFDSVPFPDRGALGAFSFALASVQLERDVNDGLRRYLGSDDHRARMATYGLMRDEIDGALRAAR